MSTTGVRDYRPNIHFSPKKMWNNDPNGLFYLDGTYHLYYQHYPYDTVWGPMHWGHATSKDLIKWEHHNIVMEPDELGYIFSGCAVVDKNNTSGFGTSENPPIVAIFTHHLDIIKEDGSKTYKEQQSIAYSLDGGYSFTKYKNNPVIPAIELRDFRDPKVFWNNIKNCWSMIVSATDRAYFYSSDNLIDWKKTGEFGAYENYYNAIWECPDLFPIETQYGTKWLLIVSMVKPNTIGSHLTQYFLGEFDGDTFHADDFKEIRCYNSGCDDYAGVTYFGTDKKIYIGWGINPSYASETPTNDFCGIMTLPKEVGLINTKNSGLRPTFSPIGYQSYLQKPVTFNNNDNLSSETFEVTVKGIGECSISFENNDGQKLVFGVTNDNKVFINRKNAGESNFSEYYNTQKMSYQETNRFYDNEYTLKAIFDVSVIELFADNNTIYFSNVVYPTSKYNKIKITGNVNVTYSNIIV